jgi:hypothetical protein
VIAKAILKDKLMEKKSQLYVLVKAKELTKYLITVTERSPKKFRFTLVNRLQNYALDTIESILKANSLRDVTKRMEEQDKAKELLNMLDSFAEISLQQGCILPKQYEQVSKLVAETLNYLQKWKMATAKKVLAGSNDEPV